MPRPPRPDPAGGWHHVMNRGVDRTAIFVTDHDRVDFGALLGEESERCDVEVHAYWLMGNHFHLLLRCPSGGVSEFVRQLSSRHAAAVNARSGRVGHLFGSRFTSRLLTTPTYVANVLRYVHRNCLDLPGVDAVERSRWSSHRAYLGLRRSPSWLHLDLLRWFGGVEAYDRFVSDRRDPTAPTNGELDPSVITSAIDSVLAERSDRRGRSSLGERRAIALAMVAHRDERARASMADHLGIESFGARRTAEWRSRAFVEQDPAAPDLVARVDGLLAPDAPITHATAS